MIKQLKNKMYKFIDRYGLNSIRTVNVSQQLDEELNKYYESSSMKYFYNQSKSGLLEYFNIHDNFPDISKWNEYAKYNNYLSSESIKYISGKRFDLWCLETIKNLDN